MKSTNSVGGRGVLQACRGGRARGRRLRLGIGEVVLRRGEALLRLVDRQLGRGGIHGGQELPLDDVVAVFDVDVLQRAGGLEVGLHVGPGLHVAGAGHRGLHDAGGGGHDLGGGPRRPRGRSQLDDGCDDHGRERRDEPQHMPGNPQVHAAAVTARRTITGSICVIQIRVRREEAETFLRGCDGRERGQRRLEPCAAARGVGRVHGAAVRRHDRLEDGQAQDGAALAAAALHLGAPEALKDLIAGRPRTPGP